MEGEVIVPGAGRTRKIRRLHVSLVREWSTEYYAMEMVVAQDTSGGGFQPFYPCAPSYDDAGYEVFGSGGTDRVLDRGGGHLHLDERSACACTPPGGAQPYRVAAGAMPHATPTMGMCYTAPAVLAEGPRAKKGR